MEDIESVFKLATDYVRSSVAELPQDALLGLYGLYKQATLGACQEPKPSWFRMEAKLKWEAWNDHGNMSEEEAMGRYVELLDSLCPDWRAKQVSSGGWASVSCMARPPEVASDEKNIWDLVKEGRLELLREALTEEALGDTDPEGMGLLHWAADRGHSAVTLFLLQRKADPNLRDASGLTPLHYASACGHKAVVQILLSSGASPHILCNDGESALDSAIDEDIKSLIAAAMN